jgi:hypothetical protein
MEKESGLLHAPAALSRGKNHGTHSVGAWVRPRARLDAEEEKNLSSMPESEPELSSP